MEELAKKKEEEKKNWLKDKLAKNALKPNKKVYKSFVLNLNQQIKPAVPWGY